LGLTTVRENTAFAAGRENIHRMAKELMEWLK
jgi:hypothetical protein